MMVAIARNPLAALAFLGLCSAQSQIPISPSSPSRIPALGFGTWNLDLSSANTSAAVSAAVKVGYRHIDGAAVYGNEKDVGNGINDGLAETGLKRGDIWVTSKLWNDQYAD